MKCEDKWSHEFAGNVCINCGTLQTEISERKMEKIQIRETKKTKKITSEFQLLVDDLCVYFGEDVYKKGVFAKYARVVKLLGKKETLKFLSYCKKRKIRNPAYFWGFWKKKYQEIKYK